MGTFPRVQPIQREDRERRGACAGGAEPPKRLGGKEDLGIPFRRQGAADFDPRLMLLPPGPTSNPR